MKWLSLVSFIFLWLRLISGASAAALGSVGTFVTIALGLWLVKNRYKVDWRKATNVLFLWALLGIAVFIIVGLVLTLIRKAVGG